MAQLSNAGDPIDLDMLIKSEHPFLFLEEPTESDILGALSMASWATTDGAHLGATLLQSLLAGPEGSGPGW